MKRALTEIDMLAAAYLAGEGRKQTEIAADLRLSQPAVSRLLAHARRKYLRAETHFLKELVDEETMQRILYRASRSRLGELLDRLAKLHDKPRGPIVRVFPSGNRRVSAADWESRLKTFGRASAPYVKDLLLRSSVCGISWGHSLGNLVLSLQGLPIPPPRTDRPILVIPLCGEPLGNAPTSFSATNLAEGLERFLNGRVVSNLSLAMVPAFIPYGFSKCQLEGVWKLIGLVKAYEQIFGATKTDTKEGPSLIDRADMILTSVGPAEQPLGHGSGELFRTGGVQLAQLRELLLGDISGICIPKPSIDHKQHELVSNLNLRWTGLKLSHLRACAERHAGADPFTGSPGVCVVAIGQNKAPFTCEAVKMGLINNLVIDDDLADELERITRRTIAVVDATVREANSEQHGARPNRRRRERTNLR